MLQYRSGQQLLAAGSSPGFGSSPGLSLGQDTFFCRSCKTYIPSALWSSHWHHQVHTIDRYNEAAKEAKRRALASAEALLNKAPAGSRMQAELRPFIAMLKNCTLGTPITLDDYKTRLRGPPACHDSLEWEHNSWLWSATDLYVLCSSAEARIILERGSPHLPVLVLPEVNQDSNRCLNFGQYLAYLRTRDDIDVHFYDGPAEEPAMPRRLTAKDAVAAYLDENSGPVNLLNLGRYKKNPTPQCFVDLQPYSILEDIQEQQTSGKRYVKQSSDLSECAAFQICGKRGAYSMPHVDQHGAITAMFCDAGEKFWPLWTGLSVKDVEKWAESCDQMPAATPVGIYLQPGSLLIQPAGTIHAPVSLTNVLMSGTMFWDSREMVKILRLAKMAAEWPHITNEDIAKEFSGKITLIQKLWEAKHPSWPWASEELKPREPVVSAEEKANGELEEELRKYQQAMGLWEKTLVDADERRLAEYGKLVDWFTKPGCGCKTRCTNRCKCRKAGGTCRYRCHSGLPCNT